MNCNAESLIDGPDIWRFKILLEGTIIDKVEFLGEEHSTLLFHLRVRRGLWKTTWRIVKVLANDLGLMVRTVQEKYSSNGIYTHVDLGEMIDDIMNHQCPHGGNYALEAFAIPKPRLVCINCRDCQQSWGIDLGVVAQSDHKWAPAFQHQYSRIQVAQVLTPLGDLVSEEWQEFFHGDGPFLV